MQIFHRRFAMNCSEKRISMEQGQIKNKVQQEKKKTIGATVAPLEQNTELTDATKERKLIRTPRSKKYVKAMKQIDQLTKQDEEIMEMVKSMPVNNKLLGILSSCQIEGCIIHAIDKFGNILEHYHSVEEMPEELQDGYQVYLEHQDCASIEVYTNNICIIYSDGIVKFAERPE